MRPAVWPAARPRVAVRSAAEASAADEATIAAGVPSRALMQRAGAAAASEIARRYADRLGAGVLIHAGTGNNGGDAWVVARALAAAGIPCRVLPTGDARTDDARAERALAEPVLAASPRSAGGEMVVVDGLLGTGARGEPRGEVAAAIAAIAAAREAGAAVVALDVPSGVDATTGAANGAVQAHLTLTFGSMKRGLLVAREAAGTVVVLDIGLVGPEEGGAAPLADAPLLVDARWVHARLPAFAADAHKGTRRKLVVIGGATGMAGATVLAARAAMASGIGMVRLLVGHASLSAVQAAIPEAMAGEWPRDDEDVDGSVGEWADVALIGPGLAHDHAARSVVERVLRRWRGPVVLDADALNVFAGRVDDLAACLGGRPALLTPHPGEFARLTGRTVADVLDGRFDVGRDLAGALSATVLLKGVPTVISAADGRRLVSAAGTPALAAAGSGDLLGGIAATLVAQLSDPLHAGACAAWAHGRAAELAGGGDVARGVVLADVAAALPRVWRESPAAPLPPVLAELPAPS